MSFTLFVCMLCFNKNLVLKRQIINFFLNIKLANPLKCDHLLSLMPCIEEGNALFCIFGFCSQTEKQFYCISFFLLVPIYSLLIFNYYIL